TAASGPSPPPPDWKIRRSPNVSATRVAPPHAGTMATTTTRAGGRHGYRQGLAGGGFPATFAAHVISFSGDVIAQLALVVLVFERSGSALGSSLTFALGFLPHIFGGTLLSSVA